MVDYATANGLMDWTKCVLEACIHGVGGTANVIAGLEEGPQRDAAIQGSGPHGLDTDRLSFDMDETYAVNSLQGGEFLEFSNVVKKAAKRGVVVPFTLQFWKPTTDAETGSALDPVIYHVDDDVAVALECMKSDEVWPKVLRESQLFEALQHGPRLLLDDPDLKLNEFINSRLFREFLIHSYTNGEEDDDYWWTIWYGLNYRLTYTHPSRGEIVICPNVIRDRLREAAAQQP